MLGDQVGDGVDRPLAHIRAAEVEHPLMPYERGLARRPLQRPVRVGAQQVAVGVRHLGLDPDAELHAVGMDEVGQLAQPVRELHRICRPVTQSSSVGEPALEPAIVDHEQLDAQLGSQRYELALVGDALVVVPREPGVVVHRTQPLGLHHDVASGVVMPVSGDAAMAGEALVCPRHHGEVERCTGAEVVAQVDGLDAAEHVESTVMGQGHVDPPRTRPCERHRPHLTRGQRGSGVEGHPRHRVVARDAMHRPDARHPLPNWESLLLALRGIAADEGGELNVVSYGDRPARRERLLDAHRRVAVVVDCRPPRDRVGGLVNAVVQTHPQRLMGIRPCHDQTVVPDLLGADERGHDPPDTVGQGDLERHGLAPEPTPDGVLLIGRPRLRHRSAPAPQFRVAVAQHPGVVEADRTAPVQMPHGIELVAEGDGVRRPSSPQ